MNYRRQQQQQEQYGPAEVMGALSQLMNTFGPKAQLENQLLQESLLQGQQNRAFQGQNQPLEQQRILAGISGLELDGDLRQKQYETDLANQQAIRDFERQRLALEENAFDLERQQYDYGVAQRPIEEQRKEQLFQQALEGNKIQKDLTYAQIMAMLAQPTLNSGALQSMQPQMLPDYQMQFPDIFGSTGVDPEQQAFMQAIMETIQQNQAARTAQLEQ